MPAQRSAALTLAAPQSTSFDSMSTSLLARLDDMGDRLDALDEGATPGRRGSGTAALFQLSRVPPC